MDQLQTLLSKGGMSRDALEAKMSCDDTSSDAVDRAKKFIKAQLKKRNLILTGDVITFSDTAKAPQPNLPSKKHRPNTPPRTSSANVASNNATNAASSALSDSYPTPFILPDSDDSKFLTSSHASYNDLLVTSYKGFVSEPSNTLPPALHTSFHNTLAALDNIYQHDVTQPLGPNTPLAVTKVTRTLVGIPGITYKYLGLRMFAHPWTTSDVAKNTDDPALVASYTALEQLNNQLLSRSEAHRTDSPTSSPTPSFNLTLVNRMASLKDLPPQHHHVKNQLKDEKDFEMGKVSVSWHADSSLENDSTIAVYCAHRLEDGTFANTDEGRKKLKKLKKEKKEARRASKEPKTPTPKWQVALRVVHDIAGPNSKQEGKSDSIRADDDKTPAVCVETHDGDVYYMLGDFNHHHQHAVLAGESCTRYTSTHRVGLTDGHTFESIKRRCLSSLEKGSPHEQATALAEVEFEWIRQFYVQGERHRAAHKWWWGAMKELEALWSRLNAAVVSQLDSLIAAPEATGVILDAMTIAKGDGTKRHKLRMAWASRYEDKVWMKIGEEGSVPVRCPIDDVLSTEKDRLPKLDEAMRALSSEKKKTKECHMYSKFGDCRKASCNRVHPGGVLKDGAWVKPTK